MREFTALEKREHACYEQLATAENIYASRDALLELGFTHLAMEQGKLTQAIQEIWSSMYSRAPIENLAIIARFGSYVANSSSDPQTREHAETLRHDAAYGAPHRSLDDI